MTGMHYTEKMTVWSNKETGCCAIVEETAPVCSGGRKGRRGGFQERLRSSGKKMKNLGVTH